MATALTQTTLSAAVGRGDTVIPLTSVTGISAGSLLAGTVGTQLYVVDLGEIIGEIMNVVSVSGNNATVTRSPSAAVAHASGAMVLAQQPQAFQKYNPTGTTDGAWTPWVNTITGEQWIYSSITGTWIPGFGNNSGPTQVSAAVASAAGAILPSGKLFHVTGTAAVTGFTIPVGGVGVGFSIIPDGVFSWTTAGNIALAGTAVVNKILTFTWDASNSKFIPSYIA